MNAAQRVHVEAARASDRSPAALALHERAFYEADPAYRVAQERSVKLALVRAAWPPGSTRARVTTANARSANAAEARDRILERLRSEFAAAVEEQAQIVKTAKPRAAKSFSSRLQKIMDKMNRGNT